MLSHEDLSRLDDIYCAISSLERRLKMRKEHYAECFNMVSAQYKHKQIRNMLDNEKAIERLKQTAKKELTRLLEELK